MINIDDRLLDKVDHNEYWVLSHLSKRMNADRLCWPSLATLMQDTRFGKMKLLGVIKSLKLKALIDPKRRKKTDGSRASNIYEILTKLISAYNEKDVVSKTDLGGIKNGLRQYQNDTRVVSKTDLGGIKNGQEVLTIEVLTNEVLVVEEKKQKPEIELGEISKSENKNLPPQVAPVPPKNYLEVEQDLKAHFAINEGERQMMIERALFRGDLATEIMKFCEHHNENKNLLNKPIRNIIPKLTGWLRRSAQYQRNDSSSRTNPKKGINQKNWNSDKYAIENAKGTGKRAWG